MAPGLLLIGTMKTQRHTTSACAIPVAATALFCLLLTPGAARAQADPAQHALAISAGAINFDLSGTGTGFAVAGRARAALSPHVALEAGALVSRLDEQTGRTTLLVPEVQLQYFWRAGRVRPYAGGGVGFGYRNREFADDRTDLVLSAAGGALIDVSDRLAVSGELRLRGFDLDLGDLNFTGTSAEWMAGLAWRLGR